MYYWSQFTGPLKLMQKYIYCLDVQKLFHSTTIYILYLVNNWFVSFNWHYLYLIILHSLQYWQSITQLPPHCGGCLASWKVSVVQPVWYNSLRYIKLQVNNKRLFPGRLGFQMDNISYLCFPGRLVIFLQFPYWYYLSSCCHLQHSATVEHLKVRS
jgi:hypothetical protein